MNRGLLKMELKRDEGLKLTVHMDDKGYRIIGYGHMETSTRQNKRISLTQAEHYLEEDIDNALEVIRIYLDPIDFDTISELRQRALVNMAFNLGYRLMGFKEMREAITAGDWNKVAEEVLDSQWRKDVGEFRSGKIADMLRSDR